MTARRGGVGGASADEEQLLLMGLMLGVSWGVFFVSLAVTYYVWKFF